MKQAPVLNEREKQRMLQHLQGNVPGCVEIRSAGVLSF